MSKRKRTSSKSSEEKNVDDDVTLSGTSKRTLSSEEVYEEALTEIKNCQENIKRAKAKLETLKGFVDDLFVTEVVNDFDVVNKLVGKSVKSINKSRKKWMSFDCLPFIPMKHILKYLSFHDKKNVRLVCRNLKEIVDHDLIKICSLGLSSNNIHKFEPSLLTSQWCFNFKYLPKHDEGKVDVDMEVIDELDKLNDISDSVVKISGTAHLFEYFNYHTKSYKNLREISIDSKDFLARISFRNLKILHLRDIIIIPCLEGDELDKLEELHISAVHGLKALLSACRNITHLEICSPLEKIAFEANFNMPSLKKVKLESCSSEILYIVTGSASTLADISLHDVDPEILIESEIQIPNLVRLSLDNRDGRYKEGYTDLMTKYASSLQELYISSVEDLTTTPDFPNLEKLAFCYLPEEIAVNIVKHSPNLKYIKLEGTQYPVKLSTDRQGTLYLSTYYFIQGLVVNNVDNGKFLEAWNKYSGKYEGLCLLGFNFDMSKFDNFEITKLTKISLLSCNITSGFENLLNACCATLEELELKDSTVEINGVISDCLSLKHISLVFSHSTPIDARIETLLTKLLLSSTDSLEKLTLILHDNILLLKQVFQQVKLPNLNILHVYPRPEENELNLILEQLPDDATLWLFGQDYDNEIFVPFNTKLMNTICPNNLYIDVSE